jgi:hypothetical protein
MFIAILETRHWSFMAAGDTEKKARNGMRAGWTQHRAGCEMSGGWCAPFEDFEDGVNVVEISVGDFLRDGGKL